MTLEFDYLLASVRCFFHPELPAPSKEGLDESILAALAARHAVTEFLRQPCETSTQAAGALQAAQSALAISAELAKLAAILNTEKIDLIPLKGPVLGVALYENKALKVSSDLDLLVRRPDALRAARLLEKNGYRLQSVPHWRTDAAYLRNINDELAFSDPKLWLKVDLHWSLLPGYFPQPFDSQELWSEERSISWGGAHLRTLSSEQQLMFLCAHGAKHLWARLGWICDLGRLIQVGHGINWSGISAQARRSHTTRMIALGLVLADSLLGVELPSPAAEIVRSDPHVRALAATVVKHLRTDRPPSTGATAGFCVRVLETNRQRARLLFGMFIQPTEAEYRVVQMPPALYWLYYLLRPMRLTAKYVRRVSSS